jgi:hypothetical protein
VIFFVYLFSQILRDNFFEVGIDSDDGSEFVVVPFVAEDEEPSSEDEDYEPRGDESDQPGKVSFRVVPNVISVSFLGQFLTKQLQEKKLLNVITDYIIYHLV